MAIAWRYSVVIPAFNEAASLARVVEKVAALPGPVEVIVVDDGSTDRTADEIARVQRDLPIVSLRLAGNRGKGAAVRAGIARATAPVVVLLRWWCCCSCGGAAVVVLLLLWWCYCCSCGQARRVVQ